MATSLLITQCLQNDFVKPIGPFEPIPNQLHVGHAEALRLLGINPAEGPVERVMQWAYAQPDQRVRVVHVRDWHDPDEPSQRSHLAQFGAHCLRGSAGARFAFTEPERHGKQIAVIDSVTLNDFEGTGLQQAIEEQATLERVGLIGVWTEAKVLFLAYELCTRFPQLQLAVCSALTASSSRQHHFGALGQLDRILGVRVIDSVGEFIEWLGGNAANAPLLGMHEKLPEIDAGGTTLDATGAMLVRFLFRDCRLVKLRPFGGGFSGNLVAGTTSIDLHGHEQVPHVLKIGPQKAMGRERTSFERIQNVLGNNAPQISDFADYDDRGAIKYRYASMGGSFTTTLQKEIQAGLPLPKVQRILDTVFGEQLMRLYKAATLEPGDLLEHYFFSPQRAPGVERAVDAILGRPVSSDDTVEVLPGVEVDHPAVFYRRTLPHLPARAQDRFYQAYVHGDLNGQNIVLDGHDNVWLIDFFHTRRAHVLMDLVKLENDLFYIFTPIDTEAELREAFRITDALMEVQDLWAPLPECCPSELPQLQRAWAIMRMLRAYYPRLVHSDRAPLQLLVAMLRYAGHTLSFDEPTPLQLRWALYTAGRCARWLTEALTASTTLRVDFLDRTQLGDRIGPGRVGLTVLPGRADWRRHLDEDLVSLRETGIDAVVCLVPREELEQYGVPGLLSAYDTAGLERLHLPLMDQRGASPEALGEAVAWIEARVQAGKRVMVHCVGGLGRSGMVAAAWLRSRGATVDEALACVRAARGPRAVETAVQELSLRAYDGRSQEA